MGISPSTQRFAVSPLKLSHTGRDDKLPVGIRIGIGIRMVHDRSPSSLRRKNQ